MSEFFLLWRSQKITLPSLLPHSKIHPDNLILNEIPEIPLKKIESLCGITDKIGDN